jgi:hypothetical protein
VNRTLSLSNETPKPAGSHSEEAARVNEVSSIVRAWAKECSMSGYLVIGGWSGRTVPINIVGETEEDFRIETAERVFLPGHGILKEGQLAFVPKTIVKIEAR